MLARVLQTSITVLDRDTRQLREAIVETLSQVNAVLSLVVVLLAFQVLEALWRYGCVAWAWLVG
jgi:hypothetical protein